MKQPAMPPAMPPVGALPLLSITNLRTYFPLRRRSLRRAPTHFVRAVDGVSLDLARGESLALVGESGCGKTTLALTLLGLEHPTSGSIRFAGAELVGASAATLKAARRRMQMVFQDPYESLNPLMRVGETVAEPLHVHGIGANAAERLQRVRRALEEAGLAPADLYINRLPHELSGGQRQRVAIAAALVLEPQVLLADEPVSMLDVSIRAEILNLLGDLKRSRGIAVLFITHDLGTVAAVADRIAVMYQGRIVELGTVEQVLRSPQHPYTRALLSVVPVPNPRLRRKHTILQGETPDPSNVPPGCRFAPRCPLAQPVCTAQEPALAPRPSGQSAACLFVLD